MSITFCSERHHNQGAFFVPPSYPPEVEGGTSCGIKKRREIRLWIFASFGFRAYLTGEGDTLYMCFTLDRMTLVCVRLIPEIPLMRFIRCSRVAVFRVVIFST